METNKKPKCYNCKHAGKSFKVNGKTHHHCFHPKHDEANEKGILNHWDTLQEFWNTCDSHEFKDKKL